MNNIKIIKFIIASLLIFIGLIILGESRIINAMDSLEGTFPKANYDLEEMSVDENPEELDEFIKTIANLSKKYDSRTFFIENKYSSELRTDVNIYCRKQDEDAIREKLNLNANKINSLILGKLSITYKDLNEINKINSGTFFYFLGEPDSLNSLKTDMSNEFSQTHYSYASFEKRYDEISFFVFIIITLILSLFSFYEYGSKSKENIIKIAHGANKWIEFIKTISVDASIYLIILFLECLALSFFNNILDGINLIIKFYVLLFMLNSVAYIGMLEFNYSLVLKGQKISMRILKMNNVLKLIISFVLIMCITLFISTFSLSKKYIKADSFFQANPDYYFCAFQDEMNASSPTEVIEWMDHYASVNETIYRDYSKECKPMFLYSVYHKEDNNPDEMIFANINTTEYLNNAIPEVDLSNFTSDYIIIVKNTNSESKNKGLITDAKETINLSGGFQSDNDYTSEIVLLENDYEVMSIDTGFSSYFEFMENPTIIISNIEPSNELFPIEKANRRSIYPSILYKLSDEMRGEISNRFNLDMFSTTNCKEMYDHSWRVHKIALTFLALFSILLLILEIMVLGILTKIEFNINKKELCLKKILGYSLFNRYIYSFLYSLITTIICASASAVLIARYSLGSLYTVLIVSLLIILIEALIISINVKQIESISLVKVLKGDVL